MLSNNISWILRNETLINFWHDKWLGSESLREMFSGPLNCGEETLTLAQGFPHSLLPYHFPTYEIIALNPCPSYEKGLNVLSSTFVSIKGLSLHLAYKASLPQLRCSFSSQCNFDWRSRTLPKVKFFLRLVSLVRLLHNLLLSIRNIVPSPKCECCDFPCENSNRVLRKCNIAAQLWSTVTPHFTHDDPIQVWLFKNLLNVLMAEGIEWNILFLFLCFELWKRRNKFVYEHEPREIAKIIFLARSQDLKLKKEFIQKPPPKSMCILIKTLTLLPPRYFSMLMLLMLMIAYP